MTHVYYSMTLWLSFAGNLEVCQTYKILIGHGKYRGQHIQRPGELRKLAQVGNLNGSVNHLMVEVLWVHECVCVCVCVCVLCLFSGCFFFLVFTMMHLDMFTYFCFFFLGPHQHHTEVPGLGVELELQLLAYTTATAMRDMSHICDLHHSSRQCWIFHLLSEARG